MIYKVINEAARTYRGAIPRDCHHEPYMSEQELLREIASMASFGWRQGGQTVGVIGFQTVKDVTLVRHAYMLLEHQRKVLAQSC